MLLKFDQHPAAGFYEKEGKLVTAQTAKTGSKKTRVIAQSTTGDSSGAGNLGIGSQSGAHVDHYNPVRDRLDEGSVVEDWIPRDASGLDDMFRLMYHRDPIAGTIVDLLSEVIWSDFELGGISDPAMLSIFEDSMNAINVLSIMPDVTREFLVLGKSISSLIYDKDRGIFTDLLCHDPSFVRLTPIPIRGFDPKIDLIPSPTLRQFVQSADPRDMDALKVLPEAYIQAIRAAGGPAWYGGDPLMQNRNSNMGGIPLDPVNTLYTARKVFNYDMIGTSLFTRLINFWALEKALINATVTSARRRSRSILHVKMGIDNMWEPTPEEMDNTAGMFIQADEDPVGAVVATRTGVDINEVRNGTDFYKWADEWEMLTQGKLRALGANDALLTGDATYSNQEQARLFFMERANHLRDTITERIFYTRLFPLIARIHGFVKRSKAELDHRIRTTSNNSYPMRYRPQTQMDSYEYGMNEKRLTQREALRIPASDLHIPTIAWNKQLVSNIDDRRMELYEKLEEKGLPVSLNSWAAAANVDLDSMVADIDQDAELRRKIAKWKKASDVENVEDEAKLEFVRSLQQLSKANLQNVYGSVNIGPAANYLFWGSDGRIGELTAKDLEQVITKIDPSSNIVYATVSSSAIGRILISELGDETKAQIAHYLLHRTGLIEAKPILSGRAIACISDNIKTALDRYSNHGSVYQLGLIATQELNSLASYSVSMLNKKLNNMPKVKTPKQDPISDASVNLFGGTK